MGKAIKVQKEDFLEEEACSESLLSCGEAFSRFHIPITEKIIVKREEKVMSYESAARKTKYIRMLQAEREAEKEARKKEKEWEDNSPEFQDRGHRPITWAKPVPMREELEHFVQNMCDYVYRTTEYRSWDKKKKRHWNYWCKQEKLKVPSYAEVLEAHRIKLHVMRKEGLSMEEIAKRIGLPVETISKQMPRNRYERARK